VAGPAITLDIEKRLQYPRRFVPPEADTLLDDEEDRAAARQAGEEVRADHPLRAPSRAIISERSSGLM
jgi:hypothetical protein